MATVVASDINSDLTPAAGNQVTNATYHKELLTRAKYKLYYDKWADDASLPKNGGRTIVMRRYLHLDLALSPLAEGVPPTGKTPTLDDFQATINQHGNA